MLLGLAFLWVTPGLMFLAGFDQTPATVDDGFTKLASVRGQFDDSLLNPSDTLAAIAQEGRVHLDGQEFEMRMVDLDQTDLDRFLAFDESFSSRVSSASLHNEPSEVPVVERLQRLRDSTQGTMPVRGTVGDQWHWSLRLDEHGELAGRFVDSSTARYFEAVRADGTRWHGWPGDDLGNQSLLLAHRKKQSEAAEVAILRSKRSPGEWRAIWSEDGWIASNENAELGFAILSRGGIHWRVWCQRDTESTQICFIAVPQDTLRNFGT
ncbi:hypothetical protein N9N28_15660 [Rubripirellula amarantea]|nr:hypothetical protein [Rubripirellula amarantea]